jgi:two-component system osmolarity sensor histidine kinase EnvZ
MISIKQFLPRSLLGRSLLIIVTPLVLLQVVSAIIFFESHWDKVSLRLARSVAGDTASLIELLKQSPTPDEKSRYLELWSTHKFITASLRKDGILPNASSKGSGLMENVLNRTLQETLRQPFRIDFETLKRHVIVQVQLSNSVLQLIVSRKRLFSSTTYVFVIWMVGTSLILFGVATIFMRNQVKPIRRLAVAADNFGKGRDVTQFKPEGAREVRQAASAFLAMRERISRQISQRTDMLAGVSHDLRTPLTRMKLQLAMIQKTDGVDELNSDVEEMEHMLEGYLTFARGEGIETPRPSNVSTILNEAVAQAHRKSEAVDLHAEGELIVPLRPQAFKRCMTNLIDNAIRYADHVTVRAGMRGKAIEITVDDDGPGIPEDQREEVFKSFYRIDNSRNPETGGVGLGLTIARDVIRSHGGDIILSDSPLSGLRARVRLPL